MATPRLQDDLLLDFRADQTFVAQQIARLDPIATSLRRPAAARVASSGGILFAELLCYLGALALVGCAIFSDKIYPLLLFTRFKREEFTTLIRPGNVEVLYWWMIGALVFSALLLYALARALRRVRIKNGLLARTGSTVKSLVGDLLKRKAAIDALEQRHVQEIADLPTTVTRTGVNDTANPAFDEGAVNRSFDR